MAPYDFKTKVLSSINYFRPKFIVVREKSIDDFREAEKNNNLGKYSQQDLAFVRFIRANYDEVVKGLYKSKKVKDVVVPEKEEAAAEGKEISEGASVSQSESVSSQASEQEARPQLKVVEVDSSGNGNDNQVKESQPENAKEKTE